jgi:hypothetical protein
MKIKHLTTHINYFHKLATDKKSLPEILKELSKIETFKDRIEFAEKNLKHLSSGSSRVIYVTPENTVLKLAKNNRGIAQNKVEANPKMKSKFINETLSTDPNGIWKISPYLEKITEKEFEKMVGIPFKDFGDAMSYGLQDVSGNKHDKPNNFDKIEKTEIYKELVANGKKFKLLGGDLARISSYGQEDGHPVVLDAGLTKSIYDEFYDSAEPSNSKKTSS